jgi:hypothetical protein
LSLSAKNWRISVRNGVPLTIPAILKSGDKRSTEITPKSAAMLGFFLGPRRPREVPWLTVYDAKQLMKAAFRKLTLTAHVVFSIGWIGAVAAFLALSIAGLSSHNPETVRGAYTSMGLISKFVIIPMCFAALATGIVDAFVSTWGLFRYYWVVVKLALTLVATFLLLMHENAIARAARWVSGAAATQLFVADFGPLKTELVQKSALAIVLLLGIAVLGIYKPWGLTAYGHSRLQQKLSASPQRERVTPLAVKIFYAAASLLVLAILVLHLSGHSLGRHH